MDHKYKKNTKDFLLAELKMMFHPRIFLVKNYDMVLEYNDILFGFQSGKQKFFDIGLTYNWVKRSIF
jgi:hypothetical protein